MAKNKNKNKDQAQKQKEFLAKQLGEIAKFVPPIDTEPMFENHTHGFIVPEESTSESTEELDQDPEQAQEEDLVETLKEPEKCVFDGCDRKTNSRIKILCTTHFYRLPFKLRNSVKAGLHNIEEVKKNLNELKKKQNIPKYIPGDGEPEIEITINEAKALMIIDKGADIYNNAVACDLRRMQYRIPRCDRLFAIVTAKYQPKDPSKDAPYFGACVTKLGLELAKKRLEKVNPREIQIAGISKYAEVK